MKIILLSLLVLILTITSATGKPGYAWHTFFGGEMPLSDGDWGSTVVTGPDGSLYLVGKSGGWTDPQGNPPLHAHSPQPGSDIVVARLNADGSYRWHTFYGPGHGVDLALDHSGNIYVIGKSENWLGPQGQAPLFGDSGGFVLKLNGDGAYQWHAFLGPADTWAYANVFANDSLYVLGTSGAWVGPAGQAPLLAHSSGDNKDIMLVRLGLDGKYQWHTFFGATQADGYDSGHDIAADQRGAVYLTGHSFYGWNGPAGQAPIHPHEPGGTLDFLVLKVGPQGDYQWHSFFGAPMQSIAGVTNAGSDISSGIAVDNHGGVVIAGLSSAPWYGPAGEQPRHVFTPFVAPAAGDAWKQGAELAIVRLDTDGHYLWHSFYGANKNDVAYTVAYSLGQVFVAGTSGAAWNGPQGQAPLTDYHGGEDGVVLALNLAGDYQWHTFIGGFAGSTPGEAQDEAHDLYVDSFTGRLYVTGWSAPTWSGPAGQPPLWPHGPGVDAFVAAYALDLAQTSITLTPPPDSAVMSQWIELKASVMEGLFTVMDGQVNFYSNAHFLGAAQLQNGSASLLVRLPPKENQVYAVYEGDQLRASSISQTYGVEVSVPFSFFIPDIGHRRRLE